jgi:hypothetical protein
MKMWVVAVLLLAASSQAQVPGVCKVIATDANDGVLVAPENHKVLYEDADVRVLDVTVLPHTREVMHTHTRPAIMYIDQASAQRWFTPDTPDPKAYPAPANFKPILVRLKPEALHAMGESGGDEVSRDPRRAEASRLLTEWSAACGAWADGCGGGFAEEPHGVV